jgi:hypothetical protein
LLGECTVSLCRGQVAENTWTAGVASYGSDSEEEGAVASTSRTAKGTAVGNGSVRPCLSSLLQDVAQQSIGFALG